MKDPNPHLNITVEAAIDPHPLTITPEMSVLEAIALMGKVHDSCNLPSSENSSVQTLPTSSAPSSYALVLENDKLVGILTERDVVKYVAQCIELEGLKVADMMTSEIITLNYSECHDVLSILNLFRQYRIRHLPVLDDQNQVLGIITPDSLRQGFQPVDLLRWQQVKEVMTLKVISVAPSTLLYRVAQQMTKYQISCVVVSQGEDGQSESNQKEVIYPLGIITERDIVQFQALRLNFNHTPAHKVMSSPLSCIHPDISLWEAHKQMQRLKVRRLVIAGDSGELVGLITQSNIIQSLDPTEMYKVVQVLQEEVKTLQSENCKIVESRNLELEKEVETQLLEQTHLINSLQQQKDKLQEIYQEVNLLSSIALRIHQSLNLEDILKTTVMEIQQWLKTDRVLIYQVVGQKGLILVESVSHPQWSLLKEKVQDNCFQLNSAFLEGEIIAIEDLETANLTSCYFEFLSQFRVRAYLGIPIIQEEQLWGLLIVHHCSAPRSWQAFEIEFLKKLIIQVEIAVQKAQLYKQSQRSLQEKNQTQKKLQKLNGKLELRVAERTSQLHRFSANLKTLHRLNTSNYINFEDLCADYLQTGCELFGLETGIISEVKGQDYKICAVRSPIEELQSNSTFKLKNTYCEAVVRNKKTIAYQNVGNIPALRQHPVYENFKLEAYLGTPIFVKHAIYGTLNFSSSYSRSYLIEHDEREIIELMAQSLGHFIAAHHLILERQQVEQTLRHTNQQLTDKVNELKRNHQEMTLLGEMSEFLKACTAVEEAYKILGDLIQPLFPGCSGAVFLIRNSGKIVEAVSQWGEGNNHSQSEFSPEDCWALRRGRNHWVRETQSGLLCSHIQSEEPIISLCLPMMAQGESSGLFYLSTSDPNCLTQDHHKLARTVSEHIALALANLQLRETLQQQSTHDPLTGLFNRRYLEDFLEQQLAQATRQQKLLGLILLDIDHFKTFNDTFGHKAGDLILQELSLLLLQNVRRSDLVCRYGGEELLLVFPDASIEDTYSRGEQLRKKIKQLQVQYQGKPLGKITVSLGLACFPDHGLTGEQLIQKADQALYQAKTAGRDRVVIASLSSTLTDG